MTIERFTWHGPEGTVSFVVPASRSVIDSMSHSGACTPSGALSETDATAMLDDGGPGPFLHRVWWVEPDQCPLYGTDHHDSAMPGHWLDGDDGHDDDGHDDYDDDDDDGDDDDDVFCLCGRVSLLEVLSWIPDPEMRQRAVEVHQQEMTFAFNHYWSCDTLVHDPSGALGEICSGCVLDGAAHVARVGGEAELLAEEFGTALSAYFSDIRLGTNRFSNLPGPCGMPGGRGDLETGTSGPDVGTGSSGT
jgi:hypothetical protein